MSEKQNAAIDSNKKKKKRNKNKNKKKGKGGQQEMDIQFSVDVPAKDDNKAAASAVEELLHEDSSKQDEETLVVDVAHENAEQGTKVSTTETVMEVSETFDANELPEDVRQELLHGMTKSNVTVVINGQEVELPPGVTPDSLSEEDLAKLLPIGDGDGDGGNARIIEVTETIVTEGDEGEEGETTEVIVTTEHIEAGDETEHAGHHHNDGDHHHDVEEEKTYTIEGVVGGFHPKVSEAIDEVVTENDSVKKVEVTKVKKTTTFSSEEVPVNTEGLDTNVVIDVQTSPWKVDRDVEEIVHHNKRVRMTKITKSRRVIITKTADGEEVETVVEEEDEDENPEVIGEIGEFDDTHNETIEIQKVVKKRRVIITKTADGQEVETVVEDYQTPVKDTEHISDIDLPEVDRHVEKTTIVKTRRVIITQNEFGEDVETVVEDDQLEPDNLQSCIEKTEDVIEEIETHEVEAEPFEVPDSSTDTAVSATISTNVDEPSDQLITTHHHYIVHKENDDAGISARLKDVTHEDEDKVELTVQILADNDDRDEVITEEVQTNVVESEVDFDTLLEPPDEHHLQALKEQDQIVTVTTGHEHLDHAHDEERQEFSPSSEGKELVIENDIPLQQHVDDDKNGELDLQKLEDQTSKPKETKPKTDRPVNITMTLNVPRQSKPQAPQKLTAEQRKLLEEVEMPKIRSVLDDWVLVNFTPEEVARFAELVRYQPGWLDKSVEIQKCCKMM